MHSRPTTAPVRRLVIYLIKPSKYDEDGYVIRYWKGVLPSNTLSCLFGLTEEVRERGVLGHGLRWRIELIDETIQRVDVRAILRSARPRGTKVIVCLVGVQSNQFARASDLALACRAGGVDVLIGGFHVSGSLAMLPQIAPELHTLLDAGVTVVAGEIEGQWDTILRDTLENRLRPIYNFLLQPPALQSAPLPRINTRYLRRFVAPNFGTLDCGRGCPFNCSFCTVVNVQGRAMRFREVERIIAWVRENYHHRRISYYFFTDDNFCRHQHWEAIFDGLIRLRQEEGIRIGFMVQVDAQSYKLPNFVAKAKAAGCSQVFIGLESLNSQNLEVAGKRQNKVANFRALIEAYRQAGVNTHVAYIIGFPFDTPASVREDIRRLAEELGPEQASFFMLTPLPGSRDHLELTQQGVPLDPDLNRYDSFRATAPHPHMSHEEWTRAYDEAWASFYSLDNMTQILQRVSAENYWSVFGNFIWYKNAVMVEQGHPMVHGFVRLKGRHARRPGLLIETRWQYVRRRVHDIGRYVRLWPRLALEMEELWLQTRKRSPLEQRVVEELKRVPASVRGWRRLRVAELQRAYRRAACALQRNPSTRATPPRRGGFAQGSAPPVTGLHVPRTLPRPRVAVPPAVLLWLKRWNPCSHSLTWSRRSLERFWRQCRIQVKRGRIDRIDISGLVFNALQELTLFLTFAALFLSRLLHRLWVRTKLWPEAAS